MKFIPTCAAVVLLVAGGLLHGFWTARWSQSGSLDVAIERLHHLPRSLGDWEAEAEDQTLDERSLYIGGIAGYASQEYKNKQTKERLSVLLLCGKPGAVAVHTPDICYRAAGYEIGQHDKAEIPWQAGIAKFQTVPMSRDDMSGTARLQAFWSWSINGDWQTPANPRVTYARSPFLYKLYVIRDVDSQPLGAGEEGATEFIKKLLPVLQTNLFESTGPRPPGTER